MTSFPDAYHLCARMVRVLLDLSVLHLFPVAASSGNVLLWFVLGGFRVYPCCLL
jgi:hypothetical protein